MKIWLLLLVLVALPLVSAEIIVTPMSQSISQPWYSAKTYQLAVRNNNSFTAYNLTFSPIQYVTFPSSVDLQPNESRVLSYSVLTNELFSNRVFVSTLSYFYVVPYSPPEVSVQINVTSSGFSPSNVSIMANDSVVFNNLAGMDVEVRDFGSSGFATVVIPANQSVSRRYLVPAGFSFYNSPLGYTGLLQVVPRSATMMAHDSTTDRQVSFTISSILPAGTVQITLLSASITVANNATYPEALIELRNTDPNLLIRHVHLSADRWASAFTPNDFDIPASGVQRVLFNITPLVARTLDTNRSQALVLTLSTENAGNTSKSISIFIPDMNMDVRTINGVNYTITVLGVNDTIEACLQHMHDTGFESCLSLEQYFTKNVTVIKEQEAQYKFGEGVLSSTIGQLTTFGGVSERLENTMNRYLDKQASVEAKVENTTAALNTLQAYVEEQEALRARELQRQNSRFWIFVVLGGLVLLTVLIMWVMENVAYLDAMQEARQI